MLFILLKWVHVLSAIVAVGSNVTYGIWISAARRHPEALLFTLRGIKRIDDRVAGPAYVLLLITGLLMVFAIGLSLATPWLLTALVIYGILALVAMLGFTPNLSRQIQALEGEGLASSRYQALASRGTRLGAVLVSLAMLIVFLMVVKPGA